MPGIDPYSVSTVPLEMLFNSTELAIGTGFIWKSGDEFFLVTNWHNVSGKNQETGRHLSPTLAEPNRLRVHWNGKQIGARLPVAHDLLDPGDGRPLWWIHPKHGRNVDVVALPVVPLRAAIPYPINEIESLDLRIQVGMDVFILGYPRGLGGPGGLPVWKRGSIATEPALFESGLELKMLIDTASRPGMSGSPVLRRSWGTQLMSDGNVTMTTGAATKFVGIYSGRLNTTDPLDAQLGIAWPAHLIEEIVAGRRRDEGL